MLKRLRQQWQDIRRAKPGCRFQNRYERRKDRRCSPLVKPFYLMLGGVLFILGLVMMPAPGPGLVVAFIGAGMLAEESLLAARALDRVEVRLHALATASRRVWARASAVVKALIALLAAAVAGLTAVAGYVVVFG